MNLAQLTEKFSTEEKARGFLEETLWPNGAVCPHCGIVGESYRLTAKPGSKRPVRPGVWKCRKCRKQFTVRVGTIFEDSHIPLHKWLLAIHLLCASKKGMSSHQIHRQLGITYKAAWFMTHRIRFAMQQGPFQELLKGTVEVDETYIGPKIRGLGVYEGKQRKAPVVSLVEREGNVRSFHVADITAKTLRPILKEHISQQASLMTDDFSTYTALGKDFASHDVINHSARSYSRYDGGKRISTNTVEGFFSIIKRGVYGSFHHISRQHLSRYLSEFDFRYNSRDVTDGARRQLAIKGMAGKRLTYYPTKRGETDSVVN